MPPTELKEEYYTHVKNAIVQQVQLNLNENYFFTVHVNSGNKSSRDYFAGFEQYSLSIKDEEHLLKQK